MRCDQFIGLNDEAKTYLEREKVLLSSTFEIDWTTKEINRIDEYSIDIQEYSFITGAWQDEVARLHEYTWPSGEKCREIVQATPWSSGPCYFLCLEIVGGESAGDKLYEWTEKKMQHYL